MSDTVPPPGNPTHAQIDYPAVTKKASLPGSDVKPGSKGRPAPIVFENPDGSVSLGLPPGVSLPSPPRSPRQLVSSGAAEALLRSPADFVDIEARFRRHLRYFSVLLFAELLIDSLFSVLYASSAQHSVYEVSLVCRNVPMSMLRAIFWGLFLVEISYLKAYYGFALTALHKNSMRSYAWFSSTAMIGIISQVLFAYMNRLNIIVFMLRLCSYVYSKYLRKQLEQASILPFVARQADPLVEQR